MHALPGQMLEESQWIVVPAQTPAWQWSRYVQRLPSLQPAVPHVGSAQSTRPFASSSTPFVQISAPVPGPASSSESSTSMDPSPLGNGLTPASPSGGAGMHERSPQQTSPSPHRRSSGATRHAPAAQTARPQPAAVHSSSRVHVTVPVGQYSGVVGEQRGSTQ
jgi:hypothetical protein